MKKFAVVLILFILAFVINFYNYGYKKRMMMDVISADAIVLNVDKANFSGRGIYVEYLFDGVIYKKQVGCDCANLRIGDTVVIEHSTIDPNFVRLKR